MNPAEELRYRLARESDLDAAVALYDVAGWGPVTREQLATWFFRGPLGRAVVVAAADRDDTMVGMIVFYPFKVQLFDRIGIACRSSTAILAPEYRRPSGSRPVAVGGEPMYTMYQVGHDEIDERGWEFVYGLPHMRMSARLRAALEQGVQVFGYHSDRNFGTLKVDIAGEIPGAVPLQVTPCIPPVSPEFDVLWERARRNLRIDCAVLRNAEGIHHTSSGKFVLECRHPRHGELLGYAVFTDHEASKLEDLLAVDDEALHLVVESTVNWLRAHSDGKRFRFASSLAHPTYESALVAVGAYEVDYEFTLLLESHRAEPRPELDADRWYVTTGH